MGPCPRQGDSQAAHMAPKWHLGIWHKKDSSPQGHPPLATTPHPTLGQPRHLSPFLEIRNPALFPEDRPAGERQPRVESRGAGTQGHRPGKQTRTHRPPCTHGYTDTQAFPRARGLGGRAGDQGHLPPSPGPFLFGNRRGRDAPCPLPADSKKALG